MKTSPALLAQIGERRVQGAVVGSEEIAEQVDLLAAKLGGDLHAGDNLQVAAGGRSSWSDAVQGIMIGNGHGCQAAPPGQIDNFRRAVFAIARGGVNV